MVLIYAQCLVRGTAYLPAERQERRPSHPTGPGILALCFAAALRHLAVTTARDMLLFIRHLVTATPFAHSERVALHMSLLAALMPTFSLHLTMFSS